MVTERDIAEFGDLWSLMYYAFAKETVDSFGDEGIKTLRKAIRNYGKMRRWRLRRRHEKQGLPINLRSLFTHYDLPAHPDTEKNRTVFEDDELVSFTYIFPMSGSGGPETASTSGSSTARNSTTPCGKRIDPTSMSRYRRY